MTEAIELGATLYVPATRTNLVEIANGHKYPHLRSMVFCTEDSIHDNQLATALRQIESLLAELEDTSALRFIRVRNPQVLEQLLKLPNIEKITGFVFPKLDLQNVDDYFGLVTGSNFRNMPTLETRDVFEQTKMCLLRDNLIAENHYNSVLALRIGGNDLLQHLGLRRGQQKTIYKSPLGIVIHQLINIFKPYGFALTAPVFEHLQQNKLLKQETMQDIRCGLSGKTAIHPDQIKIIEACWRVLPADLTSAKAILDAQASAVFKLNGSMCEVATHKQWAQQIMQRYKLYGKKNS